VFEDVLFVLSRRILNRRRCWGRLFLLLLICLMVVILKVEIKEEIKRELWKMKETSLEGEDNLLALMYELCKLVP
jgi:hypothetical protein